jgi:hypothetical protein
VYFPRGILSAHSTSPPCYVVVTAEEIHETPLPVERGMGLVLPPIEAYHVQHLPIVKAYADKIGVVEASNELVPTEMAIAPGTVVLGMILATLSGRSPLYRLEEFFTHQDTALL